MHYLSCPYCGSSYEETEFTYGGELPPRWDSNVGDVVSIADLFVRKNTRGLLDELWLHSHGCMRWFRVRRDTASHKVQEVRPLSDAGPESEKEVGM
jgi:heterotetrameric sarcosine oxidase delta subunit